MILRCIAVRCRTIGRRHTLPQPIVRRAAATPNSAGRCLASDRIRSRDCERCATAGRDILAQGGLTGLADICVWQALAVVVLVLWQLELNGILLLGAAGPAVEFRVVDALSGDPIERARISLRKDGAAGNEYKPPPQWVPAVACNVTVRPL